MHNILTHTDKHTQSLATNSTNNATKTTNKITINIKIIYISQIFQQNKLNKSPQLTYSDSHSSKRRTPTLLQPDNDHKIAKKLGFRSYKTTNID